MRVLLCVLALAALAAGAAVNPVQSPVERSKFHTLGSLGLELESSYFVKSGKPGIPPWFVKTGLLTWTKEVDADKTDKGRLGHDDSLIKLELDQGDHGKDLEIISVNFQLTPAGRMKFDTGMQRLKELCTAIGGQALKLFKTTSKAKLAALPKNPGGDQADYSFTYKAVAKDRAVQAGFQFPSEKDTGVFHNLWHAKFFPPIGPVAAYRFEAANYAVKNIKLEPSMLMWGGWQSSITINVAHWFQWFEELHKSHQVGATNYLYKNICVEEGCGLIDATYSKFLQVYADPANVEFKKDCDAGGSGFKGLLIQIASYINLFHNKQGTVEGALRYLKETIPFMSRTNLGAVFKAVDPRRIDPASIDCAHAQAKKDGERDDAEMIKSMKAHVKKLLGVDNAVVDFAAAIVSKSSEKLFPELWVENIVKGTDLMDGNDYKGPDGVSVHTEKMAKLGLEKKDSKCGVIVELRKIGPHTCYDVATKNNLIMFEYMTDFNQGKFRDMPQFTWTRPRP